MALITCRECKAKISDSAKSCPQCGAEPEKPMSRLKILFVGAVLIAIVAAFSKPSDPVPVAKVVTPEEAANNARAKEQADTEINQVLNGARLLKTTMKKPETFKLLSATMIGGKTICYVYQGRNSFNDVTTEQFVIGVGVASTKASDWNRLCAGKSGTDYTSVRAVM